MGNEAHLPELRQALLRYEEKSAGLPACKTAYDPENLLRARRGRSAEKKAAVKDAAEEVIDDLPVADAEAPEEAVIEDAEELADDAVEEVVEVEERTGVIPQWGGLNNESRFLLPPRLCY